MQLILDPPSRKVCIAIWRRPKLCGEPLLILAPLAGTAGAILSEPYFNMCKGFHREEIAKVRRPAYTSNAGPPHPPWAVRGLPKLFGSPVPAPYNETLQAVVVLTHRHPVPKRCCTHFARKTCPA